PRDVCRSRPAPTADQTHHHRNRQTHSGPQARQSPAIGPHARSCPLCTDPARQHLQHRRNLSARHRRPQLHCAAVQLGLPSLRSLQAARQRPCRKAAPLPTLPFVGRGIFGLPDLLGNSSTASSLRSPLLSSTLSPPTKPSPTAGARRSTGYTSALPTPSTISCEPSASHSPTRQREQNPR